MHNIRNIPLHFCTEFKIFLDEKYSEWLVGQGETSRSPRIKLLLLPLALQPTVGFGLSNNVFPFFFYLPPTLSIFSLPALEELFLLPLSILSWVFPFFSSLPVLEWRSFWASYPPPFSLGDLTSLSFALSSILLHVISSFLIWTSFHLHGFRYYTL